MATVRKTISTTASPDAAWSALRDIGALHTRLVPGFVVDTKLEPGARIVTFGSGGPTRVPRNVVRALFARFAERGTESAFRQGMEVRIVKGPLAQLIARIEEASEADRIRVLLELMSGTVKTTISREALEVL